MSNDPKGFVDGYNLYAYVKNNPLKYTDPFGLMARSSCFCSSYNPWSRSRFVSPSSSISTPSYIPDPVVFSPVYDSSSMTSTTSILPLYSSFLDVVKAGASGKVGPGYGMHVKGKIGPLKAGIGAIVGAGGIKLDSRGRSLWGKSTADIELSLGRYGGRAYLWDVDIDSQGVNNIDTLGASKPNWDWSIGLDVTLPPYSVEVEYDFQPLIDYVGDKWLSK